MFTSILKQPFKVRFSSSVNCPFTAAALLPCPICMCTFPLVTIYVWDICQVLEVQVVISVWVYPRSLDLLLAHSFVHFQTLDVSNTFLLMRHNHGETWVLFCLSESPHFCRGKDYHILEAGQVHRFRSVFTFVLQCRYKPCFSSERVYCFPRLETSFQNRSH